MLTISIIILIVVIALNTSSVKGFVGISPILLCRITSIIFLYSGALTFNALYIQQIGSGIGLYSGNFQVTLLSQSIDLFIFIMASLILIPWSNRIPKWLSLSNSEAESLLGEINPKHSFFSRSHISKTEEPVSSEYFIGRNSPYLRSNGPNISEYSLIILFSTLGSSLLLSSINLVSMYLSIELQSFGVYILATIYRNSESATNAGLKYFFLGGLSSCLILLGSGLIYSYTGLTSFEGIYSLVTTVSMDAEGLVQGFQLGLILIFIGLLFKIAAAPFHNWAPDVYNDVPTIVTTWLTIMPKLALILLMIEIVTSLNLDQIGLIVGQSTISNCKNLFLLSSLLSLLIGTILGLSQVKIKRLLAYSTISHVGFMLLALAINTEDSIASLLFYLIQYSITNLNAFLILLAFGYLINLKARIFNAKLFQSIDVSEESHGDISFIKELKGQFYSNPLLSLSLAVSLFSMAGIPPLVGFFAKQQVLYSSLQSGYYFISIIAILVSVISAYYYLQIIKVMHFDITPKTEVKHNKDDLSFMPEDLRIGLAKEEQRRIAERLNNTSLLTNTHSFLISMFTLSLVLFMFKPSILLNSTSLMALNIFYS